jgi:hypothetical protein
MKRIFLIILFASQINNAESQNITDTVQYLRDSINGNAAYFTGKQLNTLLSELKLEVKDYSSDLPLPSKPEIIYVNSILLYFEDNSSRMRKTLERKKIRNIYIAFTMPVAVPKAYLKRGGLLDATTNWNTAKANFFGSSVIASISARGID